MTRQRVGGRAGVISAAIAWGVFVSLAAGADDRKPRVGPLGDPARLTVEGSHTFTPEQIRRAIDKDVPVQIASAPTAPLDGYLRALESRVAAGFRGEGFPDATVTAAAREDGGAVVLTVVEGARRKRGKVRVNVAGPGGAIPVDDLVARLTTARAPSSFMTRVDRDAGTLTVSMDAPDDDDGEADQIAWEPGSFADFAPWELSHLKTDVSRSLASLGFFRTRFEVRIDVAKDDPQADAELVIDVADPGPRATLGKVEIVGSIHSKPEDIRAHCGGLREGEVLDREQLLAVQERLWEAGRFKKHVVSVAPVPSAADPGEVSMRIELEEVPELPPLGKPFTELERAMLRFREYLLAVSRGEEDFVLEGQSGGYRIEAAIGFSRGLALKLPAGPAPGNDDDDARPGPREWFGAKVMPGNVAAYDLVARTRLSYAAPDSRMVFKLASAPEVDPKTGEAKWRVNVNASIERQGRHDAGPVAVTVRLAPASFAYMAHGGPFKMELTDGVVRSTNPAYRFSFDAATGRLIEFQTEVDGERFVGRTERGGVARLAAALDAETAETMDLKAPVGSIARFGLGVVLNDPRGRQDAADANAAAAAVAKSRRVGEALRKLLSPEVTQPLDELVASLAAGANGERFKIPLDAPPGAPGGPPASWQGMVALFALPYVNELFPRESWPWTVSREMLLVYGGRPSESAAEVSRVFDSRQTGPLGYAVCGDLLARSHPPSGAFFARRGLRRLSAEHFERDVDALIGGDKAVPRFLSRALVRLGELPEEDVDAIAMALKPRDVEALRRLAAAARQARAAGGANDLAAMSRAVWEGGVGAVVERRLRAIAGAVPE